MLTGISKNASFHSQRFGKVIFYKSPNFERKNRKWHHFIQNGLNHDRKYEIFIKIQRFSYYKAFAQTSRNNGYLVPNNFVAIFSEKRNVIAYCSFSLHVLRCFSENAVLALPFRKFEDIQICYTGYSLNPLKNKSRYPANLFFILHSGIFTSS